MPGACLPTLRYFAISTLRRSIIGRRRPPPQQRIPVAFVLPPSPPSLVLLLRRRRFGRIRRRRRRRRTLHRIFRRVVNQKRGNKVYLLPSRGLCPPFPTGWRWGAAFRSLPRFRVLRWMRRSAGTASAAAVTKQSVPFGGAAVVGRPWSAFERRQGPYVVFLAGHRTCRRNAWGVK
jgi:hypothetical protein